MKLLANWSKLDIFLVDTFAQDYWHMIYTVKTWQKTFAIKTNIWDLYPISKASVHPP